MGHRLGWGFFFILWMGVCVPVLAELPRGAEIPDLGEPHEAPAKPTDQSKTRSASPDQTATQNSASKGPEAASKDLPLLDEYKAPVRPERNPLNSKALNNLLTLFNIKGGSVSAVPVNCHYTSGAQTVNKQLYVLLRWARSKDNKRELVARVVKKLPSEQSPTAMERSLSMASALHTSVSQSYMSLLPKELTTKKGIIESGGFSYTGGEHPYLSGIYTVEDVRTDEDNRRSYYCDSRQPAQPAPKI